MQQRNVLEYLEKTVTEVPDKTAYEDGAGNSLTFSEVYDTSRTIGTVLDKKGYYSEPVVIFMKKTPFQIAAFLGVITGGCFYVAIDDEMPKMRIELIFKTLNPRVMICDKDTFSKAQEMSFPGEILVYEEFGKETDTDALARIRDKQIDTDPIYVVFTSGSTGVPKGVVACHRSVIDYIEQLSVVLKADRDTVFGNQSPFSFDACLKEIYPTLKFGAKAVIVPRELFMFPMKLVEFLNDHEINTICWVVSALTMISSFKTFEKVKPLYLRTMAFGSEVFPIKQFDL
ncbi:MAG: AMP-binding protein, partial [Clostridiales bacterium]|nr:AMP-binding protein [Clostridiales bacterium]